MRWDKLTLHKSLGGFDFCNLEAFNLSMLSKQSWKLLIDFASLLARVLKVKYFPDGISWMPTLATIQSIHGGVFGVPKIYLPLGHRRKMGDGSKINVWSMPWIRNLPSLKPSSPSLQNFDDLTINYLLNSGLNSWNNTLVLAIFTSSDATAILPMSLYSRSTLDLRVWKPTFDGSYIVKSAYRTCSDLIQTNSPSHGCTRWKSIWNIYIPPRVRGFIWRLAHQCLPMRANLLNHGISCEYSCFLWSLLKRKCIRFLFARSVINVGISLGSMTPSRRS